MFAGRVNVTETKSTTDQTALQEAGFCDTVNLLTVYNGLLFASELLQDQSKKLNSMV
jgi:hypothetical protein